MNFIGDCRRAAVQAAWSCVPTPCAQTAVWSSMCIFVSRLDTCSQPPWGLVPGCTRTQVARTHISTVSYRREHATARTHPHTPQHPNASAHAHGHISAPRTRSRTSARARAWASTRARTRARTEDDILNNLCRQHVSCRTGSSACACAPRGL